MRPPRRRDRPPDEIVGLLDEDVGLIKIRPRGNESIQQMLKRFKRLCQREGLTRDMKRHSYYEKPSERKRRQSRKAARKAERDEQMAGGR